MADLLIAMLAYLIADGYRAESRVAKAGAWFTCAIGLVGAAEDALIALPHLIARLHHA